MYKASHVALVVRNLPANSGVRMAITKKSTNNRSWRGRGEKGALPPCWWECKLEPPPWRQSCAGLCRARSLSRVWLFVTPWTVARQAPLSRGILQARILEWVAMPPSGDLPNPGIKPGSPAWSFLKNLKTELPYDPTIPLLGIHLQKNMIRKDTRTTMFIVALFTTAKTWEQPKCLLTQEWIKKMWSIYTRE